MLSGVGILSVHPLIDFLVARHAVLHVLVPRERLKAGFNGLHGDAAIHRADQGAQVAPHAVFLDNDGLAALAAGIDRDALMRGVVTCDVAQLAADAGRGVYLRHGLVVEV